MINRARFNQTLDYVRRSGVHNTIDRALRINQGGAPRDLSVDVLLAAIMLCYSQRN